MTGRGREDGVEEAKETLRLCDCGVDGLDVRPSLARDLRLPSPFDAERGPESPSALDSPFDRDSLRESRVGKRFILLDMVLELLARLLGGVC